MKSKNNKLPKVAYFCMEYGLHEEFKIYSGGLGILAGDYMKAAKDGSYPMVGIGILWRQGYTRQTIDQNGKPCDSFHEYSYDSLEDTGIEVKVRIRGRQVTCKVWLCQNYGNVPLYLLDTNHPDNADRFITGQLYGWFSEERIAQEMVLGIGGVKVLKALGYTPDIYHFNEGHAVFAGIELIRDLMDNDGLSFKDALSKVRKKIVFTTHTPVDAGNEVHEHELLQYMGAYNGLTFGQMLKLGGDPFNMTVAGLRLSYKANAVAQLHGKTAKKMWKNVDDACDIIAITNGVHNGTWQDESIKSAYEAETDLWIPHIEAKRKMIYEISKRNFVNLDENVLTIGFARRAAPYKRSDFIFRKKDIIEPLLKEKKLQLIFSGKAHPNDLTGKEIVSTLYKMSEKYPGSVVFIQDYDMNIGKLLTRGCDVWLNNPIRPMEASGTSGMKAAMNGVLNLSILDGWWPEGCKHGKNGWQIGDGYEGKDQDNVDLKSLYEVLLEEVIPTYYEKRSKWVDMMRESIKMSMWNFSAARMIEEYYEELYPKVSKESRSKK
ncbi:alpha-glucan family phosphorylase [Pseudobacteroides cellulosolvens]|uniref:glycogen phosphorylase n=1 Tax=Pseudobacteroides cellulosolvens ATCC 35603 = DSM 2933 TaxID=398512 RepID=A0A0L6JS28_9FIRM|nr:alpha-glucan family phosphorylase [Pseudobacteroides cellulosolvens]KNY28651.1 alpha-glucan phosphorylase [Pseudobacteroides cellulosolvens ATCC 35603 = DSM 2933]